MRIVYEITHLPSEKELPHYYAHFEGKLKIEFNGELFFEETILLAELAITINKWLNMAEPGDFVYETMYHDESPIVAFMHVEKDLYKPVSVWQKYSAAELVKKETIVGEFQKYVIGIQKNLKSPT